MARRVAVAIAFVGLLFLGWGAAVRGEVSLPPGVDPATRGPMSGRYLFLFVWENNTAALTANPTGPPQEEAASFNEDTRSLYLARPGGEPRPDTIVGVLHRIDSLDVNLKTEFRPIRRIPEVIDLAAPIEIRADVHGPDGKYRETRNVVANDRRLLPGELVIREVKPDGTVTLLIGSREVTLAPGEGWSEGRAFRNGSIEVLPQDSRWDEEVARALDNGDPLTVLSIVNHGYWERSKVTVGGRPGQN